MGGPAKSRTLQQRAASAAGGAAFAGVVPRVGGAADALLGLGGAPGAEPEQEALETVISTVPVRAAPSPGASLPLSTVPCLQSVGAALHGQVHSRDEEVGAAEPPLLRARLSASVPCESGLSVLAASVEGGAYAEGAVMEAAQPLRRSGRLVNASPPVSVELPPAPPALELAHEPVLALDVEELPDVPMQPGVPVLPPNPTMADHKVQMLAMITSSAFWFEKEKWMAKWDSFCAATFNPFPFSIADSGDMDEEALRHQFTGMMMCAYCGVVGLGAELTCRGKRTRVVNGGGVKMHFVPAEDGEAPAAVALPWLAGLVVAHDVPHSAGNAAAMDADDADNAIASDADEPEEPPAAQPPAEADGDHAEGDAPEDAAVGAFWNACAACLVSKRAREQRMRYLVHFTTAVAKKLHSVTFSCLLHKLSVVDVRSQVQRLHNGAWFDCGPKAQFLLGSRAVSAAREHLRRAEAPEARCRLRNLSGRST